MERMGVEEGEYIESKMVTRAVEKAQKKVENLHFESRKHLLEYDDVANEQRKIVYRFRHELLNPDFQIGEKIEDPLVEYKKESYNLFTELVESIKFETLKTLYMIRFKSEEEMAREEAALERMKAQMEAATAEIETNKDEELKPIVKSKKPARNDPCPCGSGKKYKHCCGKSGPKRGVLAAEQV